jgi:hypothetical protein
VQSEPLAFTAAMNALTNRKPVEKLAEGSFKEVFQCGNDVIQVMPIEGNTIINDQEQMTADKAIPEMAAYVQLSRLQSPTPALQDPEGLIHCPPLADMLATRPCSTSKHQGSGNSLLPFL